MKAETVAQCGQSAQHAGDRFVGRNQAKRSNPHRPGVIMVMVCGCFRGALSDVMLNTSDGHAGCDGL